MALPNDVALEVLERHRSGYLKNLYAQSSARYVLHEVKEDPDNFPRFDPFLEDKVTTSAYSIMAAGVSLHEASSFQYSVEAIEEAASLLTNIHLPQAGGNAVNAHHALVASMAYYACGQYSRAFVTIQPTPFSTRLATMIRLFLIRERKKLIHILNEVLIPERDPISCVSLLCEPAVELAVAQAISHLLEFQATGKKDHLDSALDSLDAGMEIATESMSPALWWITRLLILMIRDYGRSSLWESLPPFFPADSELLQRYIQISAFNPQPVTELWRSQVKAIQLALDTETTTGAVVNMRTSAGKTRIAELAILQTLTHYPEAKILYIAPYRSLALEIEQSMSQVFDGLGHRTSHLYGGFRFSAADRKLAKDATIVIATPEKTRAIVRSSPDLLSEFKLIVVDEGHLIGEDERLVRNELFLEHLRIVGQASGGRMLLLSAVIPNPADLAHWVSGSRDNVVKSRWKPSAERFGLLQWDGNRVRIDWKGEFESFNPSFVRSKPLGWGRRRNNFPNDKNEAVAATAVRLTSIGPVMIFCGQARSVPRMASCVRTALGESPEPHPWPEHLWDTFRASCQEELGLDGDKYIEAAELGIICHSNRLPPQVRMATERLMRSTQPKVIVATSTLAQGVNIGISSVIIASPYIGENKLIRHSDFWNICGRAGRAFVDGEGKVLYAIDEKQAGWRVRKNRGIAEKYFDSSNANPVKSGLLSRLSDMRRIASSAGVDFETLLNFVAENDFTAFWDDQKAFDYFDLMIDDALLAIIEDLNSRPEIGDENTTIDRELRYFLAVIQAGSSECSDDEMTEDEVLRILQCRAKYLISNCPDNDERRACVSSGLPYQCARNLYRDRAEWKAAVETIVTEEIDFQLIVQLLEWIEEWVRLNGDGVIGAWQEKSEFDLIRDGWIKGLPTSDLNQLTPNAGKICKDVYGYQLPWLIHAGSQVLAKDGNDEHSEVLDILAALVEFGLPNITAVNVFLAGIRSRKCACEIAETAEEWRSTPAAIRKQLCDPEVLTRIHPLISADTKSWINLLGSDAATTTFSVPDFPSFTLDDEGEAIPDKLLVRSFDNIIYLCSVDGRMCMEVETEEEWPLDIIADDLRFAFSLNNGSYQLEIRDPRLTTV